MNLTHVGMSKDSVSTYDFEVYKQGHVYSVITTKNGKEYEHITGLDSMKQVRMYISRFNNEYTLEKQG